MVSQSPKLLLFIEPILHKSDTPVIDDYVRILAASFAKAVTGTISDDQFNIESGYMGHHNCVCGAGSTAFDYKLTENLFTNSLAIHYLVWHRQEVPSTELEKIRTLPLEYAEPSEKQLSGL